MSKQELEKDELKLSREILDRLLDFIARQFSVDKEEIELDKSLIDEGIIDSFGLVEITSFIEEQFSIVVTDDQMNRNNFGSVLKIVGFIQGRINK